MAEQSSPRKKERVQLGCLAPVAKGVVQQRGQPTIYTACGHRVVAGQLYCSKYAEHSQSVGDALKNDPEIAENIKSLVRKADAGDKVIGGILYRYIMKPASSLVLVSGVVARGGRRRGTFRAEKTWNFFLLPPCSLLLQPQARQTTDKMMMAHNLVKSFEDNTQMDELRQNVALLDASSKKISEELSKYSNSLVEAITAPVDDDGSSSDEEAVPQQMIVAPLPPLPQFPVLAHPQAGALVAGSGSGSGPEASPNLPFNLPEMLQQMKMRGRG